MRNRQAALAASLALCVGACTTTSGESPGFLQTMQQVVGGLSMAVGAAAGDQNLAQSGANMFQQGMGSDAPPAYTPVAATRSPPPVAAKSSGPVAQADSGSSPDLNAVAQRCTQIAESKYARQAQNVLMQRAACLSLCAHSITGIQRYHAMYLENQRNANSLCSAGISPRCNDIDTAYCRYH